jgi:uncharacterized protein YkuJ
VRKRGGIKNDERESKMRENLEEKKKYERDGEAVERIRGNSIRRRLGRLVDDTPNEKIKKNLKEMGRRLTQIHKQEIHL